MGRRLAETVIAHHRRRFHGRARRITIDLDPTDDPTQWPAGAELLQWALRHRVLSAAGRHPDLRRRAHPVPGRDRAAARQCRGESRALGWLRWLFRTLRQAFPRATLRVRLDGGFAGPRLLTVLDRAGVEYVVGLPGNPGLNKRVCRLLGRAWAWFRATGQATPLFGETRYVAKSWGASGGSS